MTLARQPRTPVQRKETPTRSAPTTSAPTSAAPVQQSAFDGVAIAGAGLEGGDAGLRGLPDLRSAASAAATSIQMKAGGRKASSAEVHAAAERGISGGGGALPHLAQIQQAFGGHDVSGIHAHVGGAATEASQAMGAAAYATGDHVAFGGTPDLHTAAHEAAHVVQQRAGVSLSGGVGQVGDSYEQHADRVADLVVKGESAEGLLGPTGAGGGADGGVQRRAVQLRVVQRDEPNQSSMDEGQSSPYAPTVDNVAAAEQEANAGQSSPYAPTNANVAAAEKEANAGQSSPYAPTKENVAAAEKEKEGGEGEKKEGEGEDKKMELDFPAGECFGFSFAGNAAGGTEVKAYAKVPGLPEGHWPCGPGFIQVKPEIKGGLIASHTGDGKWEGTVEVSASAAASFRLGIPKVASVGVGAELTGSMSVKVSYANGKWSGTPPQMSLKGGIFVDVQVFETSQKVTVGEAELVKIVGTETGYSIQPGADVANLYQRIKDAADRAINGSGGNGGNGGQGGAGGGGAGAPAVAARAARPPTTAAAARAVATAERRARARAQAMTRRICESTATIWPGASAVQTLSPCSGSLAMTRWFTRPLAVGASHPAASDGQLSRSGQRRFQVE
ncbi:MAG: DUF4157 domain-containing protein [Myxococcota bacterium]